MIAPKKIIDLSTWSRRDYFEFFNNMPDPFFGLSAKVDFTECYKQAKTDNKSFFIYYLHRIMQALNSVPELRCRIENGHPVIYDYVGVSSTIGRDDGTFGYSYIEYYADREKFVSETIKEVNRVKNGHGLMLSEQEGRQDTTYFTAIPWVDFTSIKHPGGNKPNDSVPKIAVGKLLEEDGHKKMIVQIECNHGLADGRHLGQFLAAIENLPIKNN